MFELFCQLVDDFFSTRDLTPAINCRNMMDGNRSAILEPAIATVNSTIDMRTSCSLHLLRKAIC